LCRYLVYYNETTGEKEKRTSKKNMDGRSKSSHDNKKFRIKSMEKQRGMAFGFRKTATAVVKPDGWMDGWMGGWMGGWVDGWVDGWMDGWMC
jgi:hypothetical protein